MRTRRITAALLIVGAVAAAGAGCGTGPSRVDAAAIVGQESIPLATVQPAITSVLARPGLVDGLKSQGGSEADIGRAVVSQLVIRDLLDLAGPELGVTVTDQQVEQAIAQQGGAEAVEASSLSVGGPQAATRDELALAAIARSELPRLSVTADVAVAQDRAQAATLAREVAAGGQRAETALAGAGTTQRGLAIRPAETPQAALTPLIGIPAGWVAAFPLGSGQGWVVVRVTQRTVADAAPAGPASEAIARLDRQSLTEAGIRLLTPTALRTGVELNPRYGVWDPIQMLAVPGAEQASVVSPVAAGTPTPPAG
ncbi:SurA N-terminal domain-containing protein [Pseudonocardia spirodelae]|uniref:SurA N-terminal domain-containing protein n=1 Tax=Pseudonocardia spirodelae TaxID=3133431 RepID=A0ABU8T9X7_9PSEU